MCHKYEISSKLVVHYKKTEHSDTKKDVSIKNVEKKGIPDAIETASRKASGKTFFPTHQTGVGHAASGKSQVNLKKHIILDVVHSVRRRENHLMSVRNSIFPDAFWGIFRRRDTASGNPLFNRFSSVFYITEIERKKERKRGKKRGRDRRSQEEIRPFRCRLPLSLGPRRLESILASQLGLVKVVPAWVFFEITTYLGLCGPTGHQSSMYIDMTRVTRRGPRIPIVLGVPRDTEGQSYVPTGAHDCRGRGKGKGKLASDPK
ncbi:hypothetical protein E6C27_scaffold320G00340 [Cucumis melo var. makuwa]|uniref:CACTA en-spm transposon protein n=1 Tax=Cucumis melo var. makuwa TaxID=1194695 RepID=A0A5A7TPY2_CUCMM|nr:hypothetical protein E6C27_scaffold320G00340 [Cucumis melo var. makuwa]